MSVDSAGSTWRIRREQMGKSIVDVSKSLRIGCRYLQGIEEGNFDGWPEKVFSTGFIRSYAKYLSVNATPVLEEYEKANEKLVVEEEEIVRPEWMERGDRKTAYFAITGAVLLVGVVLAFFTMRRWEPPAPPLQTVRTDNVAPVSSVDKTAPVAFKASASATDNAAVGDKAPQEGVAAQTATEALPLDAVSEEDKAVALSSGGPYQLFLEASDHTWLMYSLDDGDPIDVTLHTGDRISIQARRCIDLKIGNAGGLVGTLNGQRLPPFGQSGQVRNMAFGK